MTRPVAAVVLALALLAPRIASARTTHTHEHSKIVGDTAVATWNYQDGNIATFVNFMVTLQNVTGTAPETDAIATISIDRFNVDTGVVLLTGVADTATFTFTVANDLSTAHFSVQNVEFLDDNTGSSFPMSIDLNWSAIADATTTKQHENLQMPGMHLISHFKGTFRDATATGTVLGQSMNFTPVPSESAQLQHNDSGDMTITTISN